MSGIEIVGLVAGVIPLVTMAKDLICSIQRLGLNPQRRSRLTEQVDKLLKILDAANARSEAADTLVRSSVQDVKATLDSLQPQNRRASRLPNFVRGCVSAPPEANKLDEVERKLESLTTQVVVVNSIFQLKEELPRVFNERMEVPECTVGLDRAETVLDFLQKSKHEQLRVVGIHGMPGVGKTTLLNCIWNKASSTAPFDAQAHIQVGQSLNDFQICNLQSIILQQLGGERNLQFTAPDGGKQKLREHLQKLKQNEKPIFLAIDNVFEEEKLTRLLPETLSKDIPASSVIVVTCRNFTVVKALLNLCHLDQDNDSQVYHFTPTCLNLAESKTMFIACGDLSNDADAELLDSLVPLCSGLPLALTVLGKLFAGNARRSREEWELIKEQMEKLDADDMETRAVTNALQVSYDQLSESRKAAFYEVVKCFYGWNWERVERIWGVSVLNDLKESSLISKAGGWFKCNQSALREGFYMDYYIDGQWPYLTWLECESWMVSRVVTMHDVTLRFGEGLQANLSVRTAGHPQSLRGLSQRLEAPKTNLMWWRNCTEDEDDSELLEFLQKTVNLRLLYLCKDNSRNSLLKATSYTHNLSRDEQLQPLLFLKLEGWKASGRIMEMKLTCEIREIHLHGCEDVKKLPDISLHKLEFLSIVKCENLQYFSASSVGSWCKLKYLKVIGCKRLATVPAELGRLKNLFDIRIKDCPSLQTLPTMTSCPLERLCLQSLPIANFNLEEAACLHLREVNLMYCTSLKELPPAIGNTLSLRLLRLCGCRSLVKLPDEVGKLTALTQLDLSFCTSLKGLPPAIGNMSSLQFLYLSWCINLVGLPDEVGKLVALTELCLFGCINLKSLPPAIGRLSSLRISLQGCESLVELPDEVGKLRELIPSWRLGSLCFEEFQCFVNRCVVS